MKTMNCSLNASGCSQMHPCPPVVVLNSEPGISSWSALDRETGIRMSSSPARTRVACRSGGVGRSCRGDGSSAAARGTPASAGPCRPSPSRTPPSSSSRFSKKSWVNAQSVTSRMTVGTPITGAGLGPQREHARAERSRRGVGAREGHGAQVAGVGQRVFLGDHAAHRDAHQVEVGRRPGGRPGPWRPGRRAPSCRDPRASRTRRCPDCRNAAPGSPPRAGRPPGDCQVSRSSARPLIKHDGVGSLPLQQVVDVDVIDVGEGHGAS